MRSFVGNRRVGYAYGQRPTAILTVAVEDGPLEELLRATCSGNSNDEKIARIEAGAILKRNPDLLDAGQEVAQMPHSANTGSWPILFSGASARLEGTDDSRMHIASEFV